MARPRKVVQVPPAEAGFILEALMRDGRIDSATIGEYRARYLEEIASLEARLALLRELSGAVATSVTAAAVAVDPAAVRAAKRLKRRTVKAVKVTVRKTTAKVSPQRAKTRELQGKYLGLMHQIPKKVVKQRFGKDAIAKKGKEVVLAEMEKYVASNKGSR